MKATKYKPLTRQSKSSRINIKYCSNCKKYQHFIMGDKRGEEYELCYVCKSKKYLV